MQDVLRVLYVDDERDLLYMGKLFLEEEGGFSVDTSPSAAESLSSPAFVSYDAIISDYQMPRMDGIAFLKKVRVLYGDIPFLLFTGRGREEIAIEAINNGADFYIQKGGRPEVQFAELAHKVRQAVARRKTERELTSIFRAVPVGIALVSDRVLLRVNEYLSVMTGYTREELEGRNTRFLYLNDEDYSAVGRMREQAYKEGAPDDIEIHWRKKDGSVIDVRITAATIDRSNPLASMTYCALDITRTKLSENELRSAYDQLKVSNTQLIEQYAELARREELLKKSEGEITGILRAAPVSIGLISADRIFVRVNDQFCTTIGYPREDIIGRHTRFLYPDEEYYARAGEFYGLRAGGGKVRAIETRFVRSDGGILDIRLYGTLSDPSNPDAGNIFIALDITDEKRGGMMAVPPVKPAGPDGHMGPGA